MEELKTNIERIRDSHTRLDKARFPLTIMYEIYRHLGKEGKMEDIIRSLETRVTSIEKNLTQLLLGQATRT